MEKNHIPNFTETLSDHIFIVENNLKQTISQTKKNINSHYEELYKIFEEKKIYDKLIKAFCNVTKLKIKKSTNEDDKDLISKINEALIFMSVLNIDKTDNNIFIKEENNYIIAIFEAIENIINDNVRKIYDDQIEIILKEIKNLFQNQENIKSISELAKKNVNNFCEKCLKRCILHFIYTDFICNIIPKISFKLWNKEIEKFLSKKKL